MYLVYIALLLAVQFSLQNAAKIDKRTRIFKGKHVIPNTAPYQAALYITKKNYDTSFCGGSLITTRIVLTAAHCLLSVKLITVMLGGYSLKYLEPNTILIDTTKFKNHEKFNLDTVEHDIAVVELPKPVKLSKFISIIQLPKKSDDNISYIGKYAKLTGWGATSDSSTKPGTILKELRVRLVGKKECVGFNLIPTTICAFGDNKGSACVGDSGGPIVQENTNTQIGLVSYGAEDGCSVGHPHVYTNVGAYLNWIEKNSDYKISK